MFHSLPRSRASALLIQLLAIAGAVATMAATPPAHGRMMLVPLSAGAAHGLVAMAVDHGAALVGPGPWPGSLVVEARRAALSSTSLRHGIALVAAPATGCGA